MAADDLTFPRPDDADDVHATFIASQLRASYDATPSHDAAHVARVSRAVLTAAMHAPASDLATAPRSRGVRPRWWWGAAAAALFMAVLTRPWRPDVAQRHADSAMASSAMDYGARDSMNPTDGPAVSGRTSEEEGGTVRFEFTLPASARAVSLVGDFNGWDAGVTPMVRDRSGRTWSARVPLEPGRHEYAFVVDGQRWVLDPLAPQVPDAGFGPTNAVVVASEGAP
jgi:hypothetical protein